MRDEFFHRPGDEEYWSESHYLDFLDDDVQGHVRVGFYPNRGLANLWVLVIEGEETYGVRDEAVPLDSVHGLAVRGEEWEFAMLPETVGEEWTVEFSGAASRYASPADVLADGGEPCELSLSLTTTGRHEPFLFSRGAWGSGEANPDSDRYEQATRVEGVAELDGREVAFSGPGERDHSWGRRKWAGDTEWLWISGGFEDGTAYNHVSGWPAGGDDRFVNGFWFDGEEVNPLTAVGLAAAPEFGPETARDWMTDGEAPTIELALEWEGDAATVEIEPFATNPIAWVDEERGQRGVLNRSPARQEKGGVEGRGFLENMTQLPL